MQLFSYRHNVSNIQALFCKQNTQKLSDDSLQSITGIEFLFLKFSNLWRKIWGTEKTNDKYLYVEFLSGKCLLTKVKHWKWKRNKTKNQITFQWFEKRLCGLLLIWYFSLNNLKLLRHNCKHNFATTVRDCKKLKYVFYFQIRNRWGDWNSRDLEKE